MTQGRGVYFLCSVVFLSCLEAAELKDDGGTLRCFQHPLLLSWDEKQMMKDRDREHGCPRTVDFEVSLRIWKDFSP